MDSDCFHFKQFSIWQGECGMRITTDAVLLGAWALSDVSPLSIGSVWDIGCGTGILSLMLAQRFPIAVVRGSDIESSAVQVARYNVSNSSYSQRIHIFRENICQIISGARGVPDVCSVDLVISNPPYFDEGIACKSLTRNVARYSKNSFQGADLFTLISPFLSPNGTLALVTPSNQLSQLRLQGCRNLFALSRLCYIQTSMQREPQLILSEWKFVAASQEKEKISYLSIRDNKGNYTQDYRQLTSSFYQHLK